MNGYMPLHSLNESIETLAALLRQSRRLRETPDLPAGSLEKLDIMADETLETMRTLIRVLLDAHQKGDLDAMVKKDKENG